MRVRRWAAAAGAALLWAAVLALPALVPGGGAGEWNWDDGLADGTAPEDASSLPEDASSTPEDSSAPSEPSSDSSAALPDGDSGGESQVSVSDST